jgi:chromate transport protein ChrA
MYGLSLGVLRIGESLPAPVYALLTGLNAATVGIIALAAVRLAEKAITDKLTRALVFLGGVAGMLYTALWYFPVLMAGAGLATLIWDSKWLHILGMPVLRRRRRATRENEDRELAENSIELDATPHRPESVMDQSLHHRSVTARDGHNLDFSRPEDTSVTAPARLDQTLDSELERTVPTNIELKVISWKTGIIIITGFLISFITVMVTKSLLKSLSRGFALFANLYLAGTIIFGGGPVVIPLLREYIVAEGWVSPRDFLLGLALIQSCPGPNFNFAVYLGSLASAHSSLPSFGGALIGLVGIFAPGLIIAIASMGIWKVLRSRRWFLSILRGVNAGAVGLVFTAVYKLWQIGFVDAENQSGSSLGRDPWWVTITVTSFVGGAWFGLAPPLAILLGGVMGMIWYAVVNT